MRSTLHRATKQHKIGSALKHHPHAFPDITLNGYGVEVKFTKQDTWRAVGNSVFEGMRTQGVKKVYVIFGKAGGSPEVRWSPYEDCVTHVRVSHSPRFVIEMVDGRTPLFQKMEVPYDKFQELSEYEKMSYIREYSRKRLKPGERLWWISEEGSHTLPMEVRLYMRLPQNEKRMLRAEAALLSPKSLCHY